VSLIVGTVGTDHHPFPRLLNWLVRATVDDESMELFVQYGATPRAPGVPGHDFVPADELEQVMRGAAGVVCHGGPGTISLARRTGHRPIVIARDPELGEHVDDHQQRYCRRLASEGQIALVDDVEHLRMLLRAASWGEFRVTDEARMDPRESAERFGVLVGALVSGSLPRRRLRERIIVRRQP
jgi:UDP-N-acetylglucosamine transferase subunit ALG13